MLTRRNKRRTKREKHIRYKYTGRKNEDIPFNVTHVQVKPGITKIEDRAFYCRYRLESITFLFTIVDIEIGGEAFAHCTSLREVVLEDDGISIKTIGFAAFLNCQSLESIILPSTLTKIGDSAFGGCTKLRMVVLNEGLKTIDRYAFSGCESIQSITLPSTVTKIGKYAFEDCESLSEIVILNESDRHGIIKQVMIACTSRRKRSLVLNFPGLSKRLEYIKISRWLDDINDKIDAIPQIVRRDSGGFLVSTRDRGNRVDWKPLKQSFDKIYQLILYYELKEAASLLELALWKAKMIICNPSRIFPFPNISIFSYDSFNSCMI